jgi:hypothetical protein
MFLLYAYGLGGSANSDGQAITAFVNNDLRLRFGALGSVVTCAYDSDLAAILRRNTAPPPLILAGFSNGGGGIVKAARLNMGITVHRMILVDPVPVWKFGQLQLNEWKLPANVARALCMVKSFGIPISNKIRGQNPNYLNVTIDTWDHVGMPGRPDVQSMILRQISEELKLHGVAAVAAI